MGRSTILGLDRRDTRSVIFLGTSSDRSFPGDLANHARCSKGLPYLSKVPFEVLGKHRPPGGRDLLEEMSSPLY